LKGIELKLNPGYETWSELDLLAGVVVGEARGESYAGRLGVALTVKGRVDNPRWWGRNWREVILRTKQFSCWDDHNAATICQERAKNSIIWKDCRSVAIDVYLGLVEDRLGGPTHYHAKSIKPKWAKGMTCIGQVGGHVFYRDLS